MTSTGNKNSGTILVHMNVILTNSKILSSPSEKKLPLTQDLELKSLMESNQSHYREVLRWEIFKEQELRFGLDLGRFGNF